MTTKNRQARDEAISNLYAAETAALERAEATLTRQQLSAAVYEPFRELTKHYKRLLRQTMKVTTVSDATQLQLRRASQELAAALKQVGELNEELRTLQKEKDEVFAMAVHDLKNPISGISGLAALAVDPSFITPEEQRGMIGDIHVLASDALMLVNDLVDLHRFEAGTLALQVEDHALAALRDALELAHSAVARRKHTKLIFRIEKPDTIVRVDAEFFLRTAGNLLSNAIKYSPPGSTVTVTLTRESGEIRLAVIDQGPGISAADQKKLFRKFVRLSARPTGGETSSGLGLAIVRRLVDAMKGRAWCESTLGRGATFHVTLPSPD